MVGLRGRAKLIVLLVGVPACALFAYDRLHEQQAPAGPTVKPIHENIIEYEYQTPPGTLREMYQDVDALVGVRVESAAPVDRRLTTGTRLVTDYRCKVLETFKGAGDISDSVVVVGPTAEKDRGAYVERQRDPQFPPLHVGERYILMLHFNRTEGGWWPAYGPYGVWNIEGNVIRCVRMSPLCAQVSRWGAPRLEDELRRLK